MESHPNLWSRKCEENQLIAELFFRVVRWTNGCPEESIIREILSKLRAMNSLIAQNYGTWLENQLNFPEELIDG